MKDERDELEFMKSDGAWVEVWTGSCWDEWMWFEDVEEAVFEALSASEGMPARVVSQDGEVVSGINFYKGREVHGVV